MSKRAAIHTLLLTLFIVFAISWAIFYYFIHRFQAVPIPIKPGKLEPAPVSPLPPKTILPLLEPIVKPAQATTGLKRKANYFLNTVITATFPQYANLETDEVTFNLSGQDVRAPKEPVHFEYLLFPFEQQIKTTAGPRLTYHLSGGVRSYVLIVRAVNNKNEYDPTPALYFFQTRTSPYFKKISFTTSYDGKKAWLTNSSQEQVKISGWRIKSPESEAVIPAGTYFVDPYFSRTEADIVLEPGETAFIHSNNSPLGLNAFKPNRCFSYLSRLYQLDFSGGLNCPYSYPEALFQLKRQFNFSDTCLDLIRSSGCFLPSSSSLRRIQTEYACTKFITEQFNYKGCYDRSRSEPNFLLRGWSIYIPIQRFHNPRYSEVRLYDQQNLLVAHRLIY